MDLLIKTLIKEFSLCWTSFYIYFYKLFGRICWHEKPRWFASWRFDEDWMKLFWTILKP